VINKVSKCCGVVARYCAHYELTEVRSACHVTKRQATTGTTSNEYQDWTSQLTKGATVCVECQPMAMQAKLGGRCYGHGAYLRQTRWAALAAPGCHGLWNMTSQREDCQCPTEGSSIRSIIFV